MASGSHDQASIEKLIRIVKIVERLTATDFSNVSILLGMGLHQYLTGILLWNNPPPEEA
jgi:hypothetical protein